MQASKILGRLAGLLAAGLLIVAPVRAGEKKLMHCFTFSVVETATEAEWQAFRTATDALTEKIPGLSRVWHGKLVRPLAIITVDAEARKKLGAGEKDVPAQVNRLNRQYGVCMELADQGTLKTYAAHPAHAEWAKVYEKVRVYGTTTFDILGQ